MPGRCVCGTEGTSERQPFNTPGGVRRPHTHLHTTCTMPLRLCTYPTHYLHFTLTLFATAPLPQHVPATRMASANRRVSLERRCLGSPSHRIFYALLYAHYWHFYTHHSPHCTLIAPPHLPLPAPFFFFLDAPQHITFSCSFQAGTTGGPQSIHGQTPSGQEPAWSRAMLLPLLHYFSSCAGMLPKLNINAR